ncbi:hypothetical protein GNI_006090 [Gregarina niphandrodes]|uniref:Uncharacterized protein n=1 Tax=Gregarina niphandrodes TaxID=110365 RepID=A0A023BDA5_GRENI|nr:hypothetical protein GNI_006090 [Gregarina niphandrodes]EZG87869.1 hypothetical protein GNI_006090 [Gregarina niphandrodes]|eukprot:XP_011128631.1 hypothetical protein GNI_006090 [Gregarina niphandrodes]
MKANTSSEAGRAAVQVILLSILDSGAGSRLEPAGSCQLAPSGRLEIAENSVDYRVREAEDFVADVIKTFAKKEQLYRVRRPDRCLKALSNRVLSAARLSGREPTMETAQLRGSCRWRWARLAEVFYNGLDRNRMLQLLERCKALLGRPVGMTNEWYLAKVLQTFGDSRVIFKWLEKTAHACADEDIKSQALLFDNNVARNFVGLPATTEHGRQVISTISQAVNWLLKTRIGDGNFRKILRSQDYYWSRVDDFSISLAVHLRNFWGPERFNRITHLATSLIPIRGSITTSDTCFFACFLNAVQLSCPYVFRCFCSRSGLPYVYRTGTVYHRAESEGNDFFGQLPNPQAQTAEAQIAVAHIAEAQTAEAQTAEA